MVISSRYETIFASEDAFVSAAREAIQNFSYEVSHVEGRRYELRVPGHTLPIQFAKKEWRPFKSREWHVMPYEGPVIALTDFLVRAGLVHTMFDIGAASGVHAVLAASIEGTAIEVHTFEMQPVLHSSIVQTAAKLPAGGSQIRAHLAGLSDHHEGERTVWYSRRMLFETKPDPRTASEPWHRQLKFWWLGRENRGELREATVLITSLDRFVQDTGAHPDLIKLDVDGYEAKVIPGGRMCFENRPIILFELHSDKFLNRFGVTRREVVAPLFDLGYRAALLTDHNDAKACQLIKVTAEHPSFDRQATTMYLFY